MDLLSLDKVEPQIPGPMAAYWASYRLSLSNLSLSKSGSGSRLSSLPPHLHTNWLQVLEFTEPQSLKYQHYSISVLTYLHVLGNWFQ
jgi:hypothetical protein